VGGGSASPKAPHSRSPRRAPSSVCHPPPTPAHRRAPLRAALADAVRVSSFRLRMLPTHVLRVLVLRRCDAGAMPPHLDDIFRRLNDGVLPATQQAFCALFCDVYADYATHGLRNPWTFGRETSGDDGSRLRIRDFRWNGRLISLPGHYVRNQQPATRDATLQVSAQDAWNSPHIRHSCEGGGSPPVQPPVQSPVQPPVQQPPVQQPPVLQPPGQRPVGGQRPVQQLPRPWVYSGAPPSKCSPLSSACPPSSHGAPHRIHLFNHPPTRTLSSQLERSAWRQISWSSRSSTWRPPCS